MNLMRVQRVRPSNEGAIKVGEPYEVDLDQWSEHEDLRLTSAFGLEGWQGEATKLFDAEPEFLITTSNPAAVPSEEAPQRGLDAPFPGTYMAWRAKKGAAVKPKD